MKAAFCKMTACWMLTLLMTVCQVHGQDLPAGRTPVARDSINDVSAFHSGQKELEDSVFYRIMAGVGIWRARFGQFRDQVWEKIDTIAMAEELANLKTSGSILLQSVQSSGWHQLRQLLSGRDALTAQQHRLESMQWQISGQMQELGRLRRSLDSLFGGEHVTVVSGNTTEKQDYDLQSRRQWFDSTLQLLEQPLYDWQNKLEEPLQTVQTGLLLVNNAIRSARHQLVRRDAPPIWQTTQQVRSDSGEKGATLTLALDQARHYLQANSLWIWIGLLLGMATYLIMGKIQFGLSRIESEAIQLADYSGKRRAAGAVLFAAAFLQLFFWDAPPLISSFLWLLLFLTSMYENTYRVSLWHQQVWLAGALWLIWGCMENFLAGGTAAERWIMLLASISALPFAWYWSNSKKNKAYPFRYFGILIWFFMLQQSIAVFANVAGYYLLAKTMASGAVFNLFTGWALFLVAGLLRQLADAFCVYLDVHPRWNGLFETDQIRQKAALYIGYAATASWLVIVFRNLNLYDSIVHSVAGFLSEPRQLGDIDFSFGSIVIFFLAIWLSFVLSGLVSLLLGGNPSKWGKTMVTKTRYGSSVLVLRLFILAAGLLIAFAASGIPMDKLTIIVGALGVGIGFGLQTIVNNLVSGIILAFEKPIEIGDQIEIAGRSGKVKEIGIRSSRLVTYDGAEVIIPNGDLLSQHVLNWTLSHHHRRVEIILGVKYGTELEKAKAILENALHDNILVDKDPPPLVLVHQFSSSSVDFRLLFWTDITRWVELKSEILLAVDTNFRHAGIEIPFPQLDIHIQSGSDLIQKK